MRVIDNVFGDPPQNEFQNFLRQLYKTIFEQTRNRISQTANIIDRIKQLEEKYCQDHPLIPIFTEICYERAMKYQKMARQWVKEFKQTSCKDFLELSNFLTIKQKESFEIMRLVNYLEGEVNTWETNLLNGIYKHAFVGLKNISYESKPQIIPSPPNQSNCGESSSPTLQFSEPSNRYSNHRIAEY